MAQIIYNQEQHYVAGTVELMNVNLTWNNIIGEPGQQVNQVYFNVLPNS
jgi:hypothetical protein